MAKEAVPKFDPNTEAFQMRAQWKKAANCRQQWKERWAWLLEEQKRTRAEIAAIRQETAVLLPQAEQKKEILKSLKPVPATTTGFIGWVSSKPDCQLEIYTSWLNKVPVRVPDVWDYKDYTGPSNKS